MEEFLSIHLQAYLYSTFPPAIVSCDGYLTWDQIAPRENNPIAIRKFSAAIHARRKFMQTHTLLKTLVLILLLIS
ncbi:MAG TPA: hypothetical protein DCR45_03500, partial [Gammaproteobacteria bacterium]|nr:hypothetical protein [Gammaproteobacteria bacterium]